MQKLRTFAFTRGKCYIFAVIFIITITKVIILRLHPKHTVSVRNLLLW